MFDSNSNNVIPVTVSSNKNMLKDLYFMEFHSKIGMISNLKIKKGKTGTGPFKQVKKFKLTNVNAVQKIIKM